MTYWDYESSVHRFQKIIERLGIDKALREAGIQEGDSVLIGDYELEWQDWVRLGIFGGTFDPPHVGHLILAAEARDQLGLDRVLWVLTQYPPHKQNLMISPVECRLAMVQAAIAGDEGFELSRVDLDRPGPHMTVDTVHILGQQYPEAELYYLMGGDSLRDLPTWYRPRELIQQLAGLGVMLRPGARFNLRQIENDLPGVTDRVHYIDAPLLEIASNQIRTRVATGRHYRHFLAPAVAEIVHRQGLYINEGEHQLIG